MLVINCIILYADQCSQNKLLKMVDNRNPWCPTDNLHKLADVDTIDASNDLLQDVQMYPHRRTLQNL